MFWPTLGYLWCSVSVVTLVPFSSNFSNFKRILRFFILFYFMNLKKYNKDQHSLKNPINPNKKKEVKN